MHCPLGLVHVPFISNISKHACWYWPIPNIRDNGDDIKTIALGDDIKTIILALPSKARENENALKK